LGRLVPRELRLILVMGLALALGLAGAQSYLRWMAPYYTALGRVIAGLHAWQIQEIGLTREGPGGTRELRLVGLVRKVPTQPVPALRVESTLSVGDIVQLPVVFWGILLAWRADTLRQLFARIAAGVPIFLSLEMLTTVCQLVGPMAEASEYLNGNAHPVTSWEIWSRLLETGGRPALAAVAALVTVTVVRTTPSQGSKAAKSGRLSQ
jgi:hypothetical protein